MTIEFNCPNCQKLLRTSDDKAGKRAKCPDCGTAVTVPQAGAPPEDEFDLGDDVEVASRPPRRVSSVAGGDTKSCPVCGGTIKAAATRCKHCGEDLGGSPRAAYGSEHVKPHRATMLLVFSILGWVVCIIFGIVAFFMAKNDLEEMKAGTMDPTGESTTNAAKIISLVQMCVAAGVLVLWCLFFVIFGIGGGIANMN